MAQTRWCEPGKILRLTADAQSVDVLCVALPNSSVSQCDFCYLRDTPFCEQIICSTEDISEQYPNGVPLFFVRRNENSSVRPFATVEEVEKAYGKTVQRCDGKESFVISCCEMGTDGCVYVNGHSADKLFTTFMYVGTHMKVGVLC